MEQIANRYLLQEKLGEGSMGTVYHAYDRLEQSHVALKRVSHSAEVLAFNSKSTCGDAQVALLQEFRTLASLRHPRIISVLDYGFDNERVPFFTMPLIEKAKTIVEFSQECSDQQKAQLLIQTLQALTYLHRRNILHRDLKPANVLVTTNHDVRVLDFGLSTDQTVSEGMVGTLAYMAPEVLRNQAYSRLTDLYSVGMIAYELFAGHYPFKVRAPTLLINQIFSNIPDTSMIQNPHLAQVLTRWLLKDPDDRYQSPQEIITVLCEAVNLEPPPETIAIRESFLQASTFVGRDNELSQMRAALDQVKQGKNAFYLIAGESGIGKSRLTDELRIIGLVSGATVLLGRSIRAGAPFQLWRNIVRRLLLHIDVDDDQASILKEIVPDIADLLQRDIPDKKTGLGFDSKNQTVGVILDLIKRMDQPLLILLEDLQWAEASLSPLLQLMEEQDQYNHVMIVGNFRNDETPDLPKRLTDFTVLELERLDEYAIESLSRSMLGNNGAQNHIVKLLHKETEGNVFFLVETVRALAEAAGGLENVGLTTLPESVFTGGMQQITQRRLDKIDPEYSPILLLAAILGREIDLNLLESHFPKEQIERWITLATEVAVLTVDHHHWLFAHDKFRESILMTIPEDEKFNLHRKAAQLIEHTYPENEDFYLSLINHWRNAEDLAREAYYLDLVTKRLIQYDANYSEAYHLLENFLERCPPNASFLNTILNRAGELSRRTQNLDQALVYAQQVMENNPTPTETILALETIAAVSYFQGHIQTAIEKWQEMTELSKSLQDDQQYLVGLNNLGFASFHQGNYSAAKDYLTTATEIGRTMPDNDPFTFSNALQNLAFVSLKLEEYEVAREYFIEALEIAYSIRIIPLLLTVMTGITHLEALFGDRQEATQWAGMIDSHSVLRSETRATKLNPVIDYLNDQLPPEQIEEHFTYGARLDLITAVESVLNK